MTTAIKVMTCDDFVFVVTLKFDMMNSTSTRAVY